MGLTNKAFFSHFFYYVHQKQQKNVRAHNMIYKFRTYQGFLTHIHKANMVSVLQALNGPQRQSSVLNTLPLNSSLYCANKDTGPRIELRSLKYWVLYNYIKPTLDFECNASITYTTHCDHKFLDNLEPLLERWQGPVSIGVYAPGSDYFKAVQAIMYFRQCSSNDLASKVETIWLIIETLVSEYTTL